MQRTILQVPMDKQLKKTAEKAASEQGFSSLQEIVRVFLAQLASNKVEITLQDSMSLSSQNEERYAKMTQDFKSEKNVFVVKSVEDLTAKLNDN